MMGIWISNKDISLFAVNGVLWITSLSNIALFSVGQMSLDMAEVVMPEAESGIYVMMMFARFCMIAAIFVVAVYDVGYIMDAIKKYYKEKNKGWL